VTFPGRSAAEPSEPLLAPGTILAERYDLERLLALGGMGAVYLARDLRLWRDVAVKVLLSDHAADPRVATLFRGEARAMAHVHHPNVVQLFATGQHGDLPFFVMEYVAGRNVSALIRDCYRQGQVVGLGTVSAILRQAAQGLGAMRRCGMFHGDVKPANMLIDPAFRVAISDFGLAGSTRARPVEVGPALSEPRFLGGTPRYVAPELISRTEVPPEKRHLCDVYSLGVSAFEMLTGEGPFGGDTIQDVLKGHLRQAPPRVTDLRPDLPPAIDAVIARALAKDPARRYAGCTELAVEVDRVALVA